MARMIVSIFFFIIGTLYSIYIPYIVLITYYISRQSLWNLYRLGTAPLGNSWIIIRTWLYIALNRTPNIDCFWVGAVPNLNPKPQTLNPKP